MNYIDLHTHTTNSDGTCTPEELMRIAAKKELRAISVTDHDTVAGLEEAEFYAEKAGIEFVPGVEIAAKYTDTERDMEFHILGYYINSRDKELTNMLESLRLNRIGRNHEIVAALNKEGIDICVEDIEAISGSKIISRAHFARFLVSRGYCENMKEAFERYLEKGRKAYFKRQLPSCETAINIIRNAGAIAVLAHPIVYELGDDAGDIVAKLKNLGLEGIEAIYSTGGPEDEKKYSEIAYKCDLVITGGSDFHGKNKPGLELGCGYGNLRIKYCVLENLKNLRRRFHNE